MYLIQCDNSSPLWHHTSLNLFNIIKYIQLYPLLIYCCSVKNLTDIHSWKVFCVCIRMQKLIPGEIFACLCLHIPILLNSLSYVLLLLCLCILIACILCSVYSVFIVPTGILRLPWLRFFRVFSSFVRQMPGYNSRRRGTARTLPK
jgi:hypothetical protein